MRFALIVMSVFLVLCMVIGKSDRKKKDEPSEMQKIVMAEVCVGNKATYVFMGNERSCFNGVKVK